MSMCRVGVIMLLGAALGSVAQAATVYVDKDATGAGTGLSWADAFTTIQAGIDAADDGDTVLVAAGTYSDTGNRDISFYDGVAYDKDITLESVDGPEATIIDCYDPSGGYRGFIFEHYGAPVVKGFTIQNGYNSVCGGGIYCNGGLPSLVQCIIKNNSTEGYGGGVYCQTADISLDSCLIAGNEAGSGGGIAVNAANLVMGYSTVVDNKVLSDGGGIYFTGESGCSVFFSIIWGNTGSQISNPPDGGASYYNCVQDGWSGAILTMTDDPLFQRDGVWENGVFTIGDYHLAAESPCVDIDLDGWGPDLDGVPRPQGELYDIGCYEYLVRIETVAVGDAGNAADTTGYGAVNYTYRIGKYEVTASQYTTFLNAVAATDTYGLYNSQMWSSASGCKIQRSGEPGEYVYSVASDYANRPVNFVSLEDACRFANWLHNGQPTGSQGAGTTETGAYTMGSFDRNIGWKWAVTSEDEWYKAAYYKGGSTNAGYWIFPTMSDLLPDYNLGYPTDPGNNATFYEWVDGDFIFTVGSPYWRTEVGAHENSQGPYGTFDQGGNVAELVVSNTGRCTRGGDFEGNWAYLLSDARDLYDAPYEEASHRGFRISEADAD